MPFCHPPANPRQRACRAPTKKPLFLSYTRHLPHLPRRDTLPRRATFAGTGCSLCPNDPDLPAQLAHALAQIAPLCGLPHMDAGCVAPHLRELSPEKLSRCGRVATFHGACKPASALHALCQPARRHPPLGERVLEGIRSLNGFHLPA